MKRETSVGEYETTNLTEEAVRSISTEKNEPEWMLDRRLTALELFHELPMPDEWPGQPDLSESDIDAIVPYLRPDVDVDFDGDEYEELPEDFSQTLDQLGIPETEKQALAGNGAQVDSEVLYHRLDSQFEDEGVIFCSTEEAVREHPDLVQKYFLRAVRPEAHKFAALHVAFWSGGTFLYVPEDVTVSVPVHAYFRMNEPGTGQFAHNMIIAEPRSEVQYIEGCSAPRFSETNLDSGAVEVFVGEDAHVQHSTVQNWSRNTYSLNTDRTDSFLVRVFSPVPDVAIWVKEGARTRAYYEWSISLSRNWSHVEPFVLVAEFDEIPSVHQILDEVPVGLCPR